MRILIDADACPVKEIAARMAKEQNIPLMLFADTAHELRSDYGEIITVDKGRDGVDFKIMQALRPGDIVLTQDYGLAAMALGRGALAINQNGLIFDSGNIDGLLMERHTAGKRRRSGGRTKGPPKRTAEDDARFEEAFAGLIEKHINA